MTLNPLNPLNPEIDLPKVLKHDNLARLIRLLPDPEGQRFLTSCLASLDQWETLHNSTFYSINLEIYSQLTSNSSPLQLSKAFKELCELSIHYRDTSYPIVLRTGETLYTSIFYEVSIDTISRTVKVRWNDAIIPLISGTMEAKTYTWYPPRLVKGKNPRVVALADFLYRHYWRFDVLNNKSISFNTQTLREESGCLELYPEYKEFNRRVIKPAIDLLSEQSDKPAKLEFEGTRYKVTFYPPGGKERLTSK